MNMCIKWKSRNKILENPESYEVAPFRKPQKSFYGPKIIDFTIPKSSLASFYDMIFHSCKSGCNIHRETMLVEQ